MELRRACSPIFWMALKYTSAASDRAARGERLGPALAPLHLHPPSGGPHFVRRECGRELWDLA